MDSSIRSGEALNVMHAQELTQEARHGNGLNAATKQSAPNWQQERVLHDLLGCNAFYDPLRDHERHRFSSPFWTETAAAR